MLKCWLCLWRIAKRCLSGFPTGGLFIMHRVFCTLRLRQCCHITPGVDELSGWQGACWNDRQDGKRIGYYGLSFLAACHNGSSSHIFVYLLLDHHRGGVLLSLPSGVLEDIEVLVLYSIICLVSYDPVLCMLELKRSHDVDWSCYGCNDPVFLRYKFTTGQVFDVMPLWAKRDWRWVPLQWLVFLAARLGGSPTRIWKCQEL